MHHPLRVLALAVLASLPLAQDETTHVLAPPAGTTAVRVHLEAEQPGSFLARVVPGAPLLLERPGTFVDVALTPDELARVRAGGYRVEELAFDSAADMANPTAYTYAQMTSELQGFAATYPSILQLTAYTDATHDGRTIYSIKLSDDVAVEEDEPTLFFIGAHHGGEMIGCDVLMRFLTDTLAAYGTDPLRTSWVDDHETRIIVIGNPDGFTNNETGITSGWRKNNRDNNASGAFETSVDGVDINRNFDFNWAINGSTSFGSSVYRGPAPGSEPETDVCKQILLANPPVIASSWHMSGEVVILPWTWNGQKTPDSQTYLHFGQQVAAAIPKQSGSGTYFAYEDSSSGGYIDDFIYAETGGLCMTIEVSWSSSLASLQTVVQNNQGAYPVLYARASGPQITGHVTDSISGAPLAAKIEILEIDTSSLPDRMSDAQFGRYRWLTKPGAATLRVSRQGYHSQTVNVVVPENGPAIVDVALVRHFSTYGVGLAGTGGFVPDLQAGGTPTLGSFVGLELFSGLGGALAVYALGPIPASDPFRGGTLLVALGPAFTQLVTLSGPPGLPGMGSGSLGGVVPNDPSLQGATLYGQVAVFDAGAVQGLALSNGVELHIE